VSGMYGAPRGAEQGTIEDGYARAVQIVKGMRLGVDK
jgi:hypothetical protein